MSFIAKFPDGQVPDPDAPQPPGPHPPLRGASQQEGSGSVWTTLLLYAALVTTGLMSGMYWDWDVSVMPGLSRLDDRTFVDVMQNLIVAIENPMFFLVASGAFGFTLAAAVLCFGRGHRSAGVWLLAALVLYGVGLVVTAAVHMPINYALVDAGEPGGISDLAAAREDFGVPWRLANAVRTVTCVLALVSIGRALTLHGRDAGAAPASRP